MLYSESFKCIIVICLYSIIHTTFSKECWELLDDLELSAAWYVNDYWVCLCLFVFTVRCSCFNKILLLTVTQRFFSLFTSYFFFQASLWRTEFILNASLTAFLIAQNIKIKDGLMMWLSDHTGRRRLLKKLNLKKV